MDKYYINYLNYVYNLKGGAIENFSNTGQEAGDILVTDDIDIDTDNDKIEWNSDCKEISDLPLPNVIPAVARILVIGDLHGDWNMTIESLKIGKVIDNDLNWIGGETIIVQVGDQVDRCRGYNYKCSDVRATINDEASDVKILKFFTQLHAKAQKQGGAVYSLLGNHELMNIMGDLRYVSYEGLKEFENYEIDGKIIKNGKEARKEAFKRGSELSNFIACTRPAALIIGSNLFVHAGIVPKLAEKYKVKDINSLIRKWLLKKKSDTAELNKIIKSADFSPFWFRTLGQMPPDLTDGNDYCQKYVEPVLDIYKVKNIIVGHTPQSFITDTGINATCDNKVWRVDVGVSDAFAVYDTLNNNKTPDRSVQILEILDDKEFNILK
jgi:hypothetical protein